MAQKYIINMPHQHGKQCLYDFAKKVDKLDLEDYQKQFIEDIELPRHFYFHNPKELTDWYIKQLVEFCRIPAEYFE